jgi:hypothetical protein
MVGSTALQNEPSHPLNDGEKTNASGELGPSLAFLRFGHEHRQLNVPTRVDTSVRFAGESRARFAVCVSARWYQH